MFTINQKNTKNRLWTTMFLMFVNSLFLFLIFYFGKKWSWFFPIYINSSLLFYVIYVPWMTMLTIYLIKQFLILYWNGINGATSINLINIFFVTANSILSVASPYIFITKQSYLHIYVVVFMFASIIIHMILFAIIARKVELNISVNYIEINKKTKYVFNVASILNSLLAIGLILWLITRLILAMLSKSPEGRFYIMNLLSSNVIFRDDILKFSIIIFLTTFVLIKPFMSFTKNGLSAIFSSTVIFNLIFNKKNVRIITTLTPFMATTSIILSATLPVLFSVVDEYEKKTTSYNDEGIGFSVNPDKPNIISIFADGLDASKFPDNYQEGLSGFHFFENAVSTGFYTHTGFGPVFFGDERQSGENALSFTQRFVVDQLQSGKSKPGQITDYQKTLINPTIYSNIILKDENQNYLQSFGNNGRDMEKELFYNRQNNPLEQYSILNWRQAQDILKNHGDNRNLNPFAYLYEEIIRGAHASDKPSFTEMFEDAAHPPDFFGEKGGLKIMLNFDTGFKPGSYLISFLNRLKSKLTAFKSKKDINFTAYDNTLIYIYGDHGNHHNKPADPDSIGKSSKAVTTLMVKPNIKTTNTNVKDGVVYKEPISNNFARKIFSEALIVDNMKDFEDWFRREEKPGGNFDPKRPFLIKTSNPGQKQYWVAKFNSNSRIMSGYDFRNNNPLNLTIDKNGFVGTDGWIDFSRDKVDAQKLKNSLTWK